jgi:hypothetical protein
MPESGLSGSVRGVLSNGHPYRDPGSNPAKLGCLHDVRFPPDSYRIADIAALPKGAKKRRRALL